MGDAELVAAFCGGDRDALGTIYQQYGDTIFDFATSLLRDRHAAADVLQDTFVLAAGRLHQLRDRAKLRAWLFAIARTQAMNRMAARSRTVATADAGDAVAGQENVWAPVEQREMSALVRDAADGLDTDDRAALDLHLRHELDGGALADALGVSAAQAGQRLHRARQRFERSFTALLVARTGERDCDELAAIIDGWDGRLTPLLRKRVARHVDRCEVCDDRRRSAASPAALFSTLPLVRPAADVRASVMERVSSVEPVGPDDAWSADGFPPGPGSVRRRPGVTTGVVAALVLLLALFGLAGPVLDTGGDTVTAAGSIDPSTTRPTAATSTSSPTTTVTIARPAPSTSAPETVVPPATEPTPATTAPPTPPPADTEPPEIGAVRAAPGVIWEDTCDGRTQVATVTVDVADASPVDVQLAYAVGATEGLVPLARTGPTTYTGQVGPLSGATLDPEATEVVELVVTARDTAGNESTEAASGDPLVLRSCGVI